MKKLFPIVLFLAILSPAIVLAWGEYGAGNAHSNPEVKKYIKEHVMPVLHQKRQVLENELSSAEKTEIAECRTALKQLEEKRHELMQQKPEGMSMRDYMESNGQGGRTESHQQMKEIMQRLQAIADKHSNTLGQIKTELEPSRKQWKDDISRLQPKSENGETQQHYQVHHDMPFVGHHHQFAEARFLLMPAQDNSASANQLKSDPISELPVTASVSSFKVFPNPASNELIAGSEAIPADNQLTILDMQGNQVASIQNVQPSQHINISQFASGTYIVQLKSGEEMSSNKVVIAH